MSDFEALVPIGAAYFPVPHPGPTRHYAFVLVPGFTLLAFSSAVEPLRIANQLSQRPLYRWQILSETGAPVFSSSGIPVGASATLDKVAKDARLFVCAGNPAMAAAAPPVVAAVQRQAVAIRCGVGVWHAALPGAACMMGRSSRTPRPPNGGAADGPSPALDAAAVDGVCRGCRAAVLAAHPRLPQQRPHSPATGADLAQGSATAVKTGRPASTP